MNASDLFDLSVGAVTVDEACGPVQRFRLMAKALTTDEVLYSELLTVELYRRAMDQTDLTINQIEYPVRTGSKHTSFGGREGGQMCFHRDTLERMGLSDILM